jgi:cell division protein FtsI/penicillin-binding protein 2
MRMKRTPHKSENPHHRVAFVGLVFLFWMALITWRLVDLAVVRHEEFAARAASQREDVIVVTPRRGEVVDRHGATLATSVETTSVAVFRRRLKDSGAAAQFLAPYLDESAESLRLKIEAADTGNFVWLKRKVGFEKAQLLRRELERTKFEGIALVREPRREYPHGGLAAHVLGSVNIDDEGIEGLELLENRYLKGKAGEVLLETDARRTPLARRDQDARNGARVVTTLDAALQQQVEVLIEEQLRATRAHGISAIVLDPKTGEILALANAPTFDPNQKSHASDEDRRRNRAITDMYDPGSVFKTVTYSAAIEERKARPEEMVDCLNGQITLGKRVVHDTHAYGVLSVADALAKSSNVGAIKMALRVGDQTLASYIARFGFGRKTGIDMPGEVSGRVRDVNHWDPTSIASIAIGQEVGVTAIQVAAMMAAIANGGVWIRPHVVREIIADDGNVLYKPDVERREVVSERTAKTIAGMLEGVVTHGTARHTVQLAGYTAAGKTGTPQKVDPATHRYSKTKFFPNFAGFVPATQPRFVIIVAIDEPIGLHQGGTVAAPVFDRIAEAALGAYGVEPDSPDFREALAKLDQARTERAKTDRAVSAAREPAGERIVSSDVQPAPRPAPGNDAVASDVMPDLRGRTVRAVAELCAALELKTNLVGSGVAARQVPAPGAPVRAGDACVVEFQ